jgi:hypothetical protein
MIRTISLGLSEGWVEGSGSTGVASGPLLFGEGGGGKGGVTELGEGEGGTACMEAESQQSFRGSSWMSSGSRSGVGVRICSVWSAGILGGVEVATQDGGGQATSAWIKGGVEASLVPYGKVKS